MLVIVGFLLTISILVIVHEFGHYLVARLFGVKVLAFSIGFGPKLFSYTSKSNEWRFSVLPFGGYVRMLDEREGEVIDSDKPFAFNNKEPYKKILIALAGPLFNILFAIIIYYFMAIVSGVEEVKPLVASVNDRLTSNYMFQVPKGTQILSIDNSLVTSWSEADKKFNQAVKSKPEFNVVFKAPDNEIINYVFQSKKLKESFKKDVYLENIGLYPINYLQEIAYIEPQSRAFAAGFKINDKIVALNGSPVDSWFKVADNVKNSPGTRIKFTIERESKLLDIIAAPEMLETDGSIIGKLGVIPKIDTKLLKQSTFTRNYNAISSIPYAIFQSYSIIKLNLYGIYQLVTGEISFNNISGPVSIAKVSGSAISSGVKTFIDFLALISLGLAIMNLLPIPVLDGGHIVIYTLEWIFGKELAYELQGLLFKIGLIIVLGLSFFAIYNDLLRL